MKVSDLRFMHPSELVTDKSDLYQLPSMPPPDDFVVSVDKNGNALSRYGDGYWNYKAFGHPGFNFDRYKLSEANLKLVKQAMVLTIYHPSLFPGKIQSCKGYFQVLSKIAKACDEQKVLMSDLSKFPRTHPVIADSIDGSGYESGVSYLHKLRLYKDLLGFEIADERTLAFMAAQAKEHEHIQYPYIPPRIWNYQLKRLNECIDDYFEHKKAIDQSYKWITDAYIQNKGMGIPRDYWSPFLREDRFYKQRVVYLGGGEAFIRDYGLADLMDKWLFPPKRLQAGSRLSALLNVFRDASLFYITNFSLQRVSEVRSLYSDCYTVEEDKRLGKIALIEGETTKTDPDSDARWVVPTTVEKAVDAAASIAELRRLHLPEEFKTSNQDKSPLILSLVETEPWLGTRGQGMLCTDINYARFASRSRIFNPEEITITEEDARIALSLTPNLDQKEWFGVGKTWNFCAHQLRRTTNVNMFSSKMVSENSIQWGMKHLTRNMTLYYGRNYSNLKLNSEVENTVILESYKAIYRQLVDVVENNIEYVRPHQKGFLPGQVINLIDDREEKKLINLIKKGDVGFRITQLGFCMKSANCEYGGIESAAKCTGALGGGICADAIFARKNKDALKKLKGIYEIEIKELEKDSPRHTAITKEIYAIGVYLDVVNQNQENC